MSGWTVKKRMEKTDCPLPSTFRNFILYSDAQGDPDPFVRMEEILKNNPVIIQKLFPPK